MRKILYILPLLFLVSIFYNIYPQTVDIYYINITSMYNATNGTLSSITSLPPNVIFQPFNVSYTGNEWQYYSNDSLFIVESNISIDPGAYQFLLQNGGQIYLTVYGSGPTNIWVNTNNVNNVSYSCTASVCSFNNVPLNLSPGLNTIYIATQNQQPSVYFVFFYNLSINNGPAFYSAQIIQDANYSISIANSTSPEDIYQSDLVAQITNYTVTVTSNTKTVNAVIEVTGSIPITLLLYTYLIGQNNTFPNVPNYVPNDVIVNGYNYGSVDFVNLQFQPTQSTYDIQITDNYPQYKTAIAIFTWNPNQDFGYVYGVIPPVGTYNYSIGTPTLTSYSQSVKFLYAIPIYIFPHNTVSNAVFAILLNNQYLQQNYGISISSNNFIIMQYNPGLNTYQILPYFFDNQFYQNYGSPLIFVKIPQTTSMIPAILYLFVTNSTYSDFSQPSSVFNYFVNLQESGYYSLLNIYTNGTVTYQQTPMGLQVNLYGGQLGFYIS